MGERILIVEDNPITRKLLRLALEQAGFIVLQAADGREALRQVLEPPDLVLLDLDLPDMSGLELAPKLREMLAADAPIVAFTGHVDDDPDRLADAGFNGVIHKPLEPSQLVPILRRYLAGPSRDENLYPGGRVLVVDDDATQLKLEALLLTKAGFEVDTARNGVEALTKARDFAPDVVLSDVLMPGMDGFDLCLALKEDPSFRSIPVVLTSSEYIDEENRQLALKVGAHALVVRRPDLAHVMDALSAALEAPNRPAAENEAGVHTEHFRQVAQQLERQFTNNMQLARGQALTTVLRSFLQQLTELHTPDVDLPSLMGQMLEGYLHASGYPGGAAYRLQSNGKLAVLRQMGAAHIPQDHWTDFFGHLELLHEVLDGGEPVAIPSPAVPEARSREILARSRKGSMLVAPLRLGAERFGVLVLAAPGPILEDEDWVAFARAVMGPISQTLALAQSFALLRAANEKARAITDSMREAVLVTDAEGRITYANASIERLSGHPARALVRQPVERFFPFIDANTGTRLVELTHAGGHRISVEVSTSALEERPGQLSYTHVLHDVGEQARVDQLVRLASHDPLTDLYNRRRFEEELANRLNEANATK